MKAQPLTIYDLNVLHALAAGTKLSLHNILKEVFSNEELTAADPRYQATKSALAKLRSRKLLNAKADPETRNSNNFIYEITREGETELGKALAVVPVLSERIVEDILYEAQTPMSARQIVEQVFPEFADSKPFCQRIEATLGDMIIANHVRAEHAPSSSLLTYQLTREKVAQLSQHEASDLEAPGQACSVKELNGLSRKNGDEVDLAR